jgi:N-acyl homoserine lactone hydrolase
VRIHAVQTGTVAIKKRQRHSQGSGGMRFLRTLLDKTWTEPLPIYVWVIEHPEGIIVIDTGETSRISQPGYFPWWNPRFKLTKKLVSPEEEIGPRLQAVGIAPDEVRWVILTHLHADHADGLHHFPKAEIIVSRKEYKRAFGFRGQVRGYLPHHWPSWFTPRLVDYYPRPVGPFPESLAVTEAGDVCLVPTEGHTGGHLSVIFRNRGVSFFFAGDASYTERLMLDQFVNGVSSNEQSARQTLERILRYVHKVPTVYLPSHDPGSVERLATRKIVTV